MLKEQAKFYLGALFALPFMPILYVQAKWVKKHFPSLPEAKGGEGSVGQAQQDTFQVVGLGESTMAGVGIDHQRNGFIGQFSAALAEKLDKKVHWKVYAKSGFTAAMTNQTFVPLIKEKHIDLFLISLGGNDTFQLNSPATWTKDIKALIHALRLTHPNTPILFTTMPPVHTFPAFTLPMRLVLGGLVRLHSAALERLISAFDQVYYDAQKIDLNAWLERLPEHQKEDFYSDGVHPSKLTFNIWGKEMAELIYTAHFAHVGK